jgi:hypothetical protein
MWPDSDFPKVSKTESLSLRERVAKAWRGAAAP